MLIWGLLSVSPPSSFKSRVCCMQAFPLLLKGRILPGNPSQLWQIARPIKEKTVWLVPNEVTTCCSTTSPSLCLHPPRDLTSEGSGVAVLAVSSEMEKGEKHRDCRQTGQFANALQALSYIHTYNRRQLSLRWFTPLVLPLVFILIILCCTLLAGRGWRLKPQGNHGTDDINCFGLWVKDVYVAVTGLWCNCLIWAWWWVRMWVEKWRQGKRLRNRDQALAGKGIVRLV